MKKIIFLILLFTLGCKDQSEVDAALALQQANQEEYTETSQSKNTPKNTITKSSKKTDDSKHSVQAQPDDFEEPQPDGLLEPEDSLPDAEEPENLGDKESEELDESGLEDGMEEGLNGEETGLSNPEELLEDTPNEPQPESFKITKDNLKKISDLFTKEALKFNEKGIVRLMAGNAVGILKDDKKPKVQMFKKKEFLDILAMAFLAPAMSSAITKKHNRMSSNQKEKTFGTKIFSDGNKAVEQKEISTVMKSEGKILPMIFMFTLEYGIVSEKIMITKLVVHFKISEMEKHQAEWRQK